MKCNDYHYRNVFVFWLKSCIYKTVFSLIEKYPISLLMKYSGLNIFQLSIKLKE